MMAAVRLAELLMTKHATLYAKHFRKEGVVHALQALAASAPDAMELPAEQQSGSPKGASPSRSRPSTRSRVSCCGGWRLHSSTVSGPHTCCCLVWLPSALISKGRALQKMCSTNSQCWQRTPRERLSCLFPACTWEP